MDTPAASGTTKRRVGLRLVRPLLTWGARPTVTIDGVGHPAQWGTGTWAVADDGDTVVGVFLFNRVWRSGAAAVRVGGATELEYRVGSLPFLPGRLVVPRR